MERIYAAGNYLELKKFRVDRDSSYRMVLYGTESGSVYYTQLMKYESFVYIPISSVVCCEGEKAEAVRSLLK